MQHFDFFSLPIHSLLQYYQLQEQHLLGYALASYLVPFLLQEQHTLCIFSRCIHTPDRNADAM